MPKTEFLLDFIIFFGVTIIFVPIFRRLKLGAIFGYLVSGIMVGPFVMGLISKESEIVHLGEVGLILLLFVTGQELSPRRLSTLREKILFDGILQFSLTTAVIFLPCFYFLENITNSLIVSMAIALSSTAYVLSYLKETKQLTLSYGQSSFGILMFQDLIIVPILTLIPFIAGKESVDTISLQSFFINMGILVLSFVALKYLLKPLMSFVQKESNEVFTAFCLLVIFGMAFVMDRAGLSMALGSFLAGVFLSESEFKKEIEHVINPFKGMFMGVFFMTFGLKFNFYTLFDQWINVLLVSTGILLVKSTVLFSIGYFRSRNKIGSQKLAFLMCQGGEFGLVILLLSNQYKILNNTILDLIVCSLTITLFLAPLFSKFSESLAVKEEEGEVNVLVVNFDSDLKSSSVESDSEESEKLAG